MPQLTKVYPAWVLRRSRPEGMANGVMILEMMRLPRIFPRFSFVMNYRGSIRDKVAPHSRD